MRQARRREPPQIHMVLPSLQRWSGGGGHSRREQEASVSPDSLCIDPRRNKLHLRKLDGSQLARGEAWGLLSLKHWKQKAGKAILRCQYAHLCPCWRVWRVGGVLQGGLLSNHACWDWPACAHRVSLSHRALSTFSFSTFSFFLPPPVPVNL